MTIEVDAARRAGSATVRGLDEYAQACRQVGQPVLKRGGTWWREVRPCFFRPMLPFLDVSDGPAGLPRRSAVGGWQYASSGSGASSNSFITYLGFPNARDYRSEDLRRCCRWELRSAAKRFIVRPLSNGEDLKRHAHPVYLEFHQRTRYSYMENRTRKSAFDRWVDAEFGDRGMIGLAAWEGESPVAVSLSRIVGDVWVYTTFFASNEAIRSHVANLMLHHLRSLAASAPGVTQIFLGMQKAGAGSSIDAFFLHRGAEFQRRPAVLRINPFTRWMLARFKPDVWERLRGDLAASQSDVSLPR